MPHLPSTSQPAMIKHVCHLLGQDQGVMYPGDLVRYRFPLRSLDPEKLEIFRGDIPDLEILPGC